MAVGGSMTELSASLLVAVCSPGPTEQVTIKASGRCRYDRIGKINKNKPKNNKK